MFQKIIEGRNTRFVVSTNKQIDDFPLFMDATRIVDDAIRRDHKRGYEPEKGPHFAIEHQRACDYVDYVKEYVNRENYYKFDTRYYKFFQGSVPVPHGNPELGYARVSTNMGKY